MTELRLDRAGRRRSPATMPGFLAGRPPRNKGLRYPADPPKVVEIIAVMRVAGDGAHGRRLRALIVILWRAGLRIQEALELTEADLDQRRGSLLVRRGKGERRRKSVWTTGAGESSSLGWSSASIFPSVRCSASSTGRPEADLLTVEGTPLRELAGAPTLRDHQLRHAHAVEMAREGVPLIVIQRQLGHRKPRHHLRLPARHRQRRDHRDRPCPTRAHGSRQRIATAMKTARLLVAQSDGPRQGAERDGCVS